jgi:beta-galactosidase
VTVEVVDAAGKVVKSAEPEIVLQASGAGDLLAVGTANPVLYMGDRRKAFQGRLMAVVRVHGEAGTITLKASAVGLGGS